MTQVSGSISLEMGKVVRETVRDTLAALLAPPSPGDEQATPLEQVADAVAERVALRLDAPLGAVVAVLAEVQAGQARLEELVQAEAQRRDRLTGETGEVPVLGPDGQPLYVLGSGGGALKAAGIQVVTEGSGGGGGVDTGYGGAVGFGTRAREASEESGHALDVAAGSDPLAIPPNRVGDPDERLAQARRDGTNDSWYEEPA